MTETPILDSPVYPHGFVTGRYLTAVADGPDADRLMDFTPAKGKVVFTPETVIRRHEGPAPALVVQRPVTCELDDQGYLTSPGGGRGVALIAGIYTVRFDVQGAQVPGPTRIEVKDTHTEVAPLDLVLAMPDVVPPGSVVVVDETTAQRAGRSALEASAAADRAEDSAAQANAAATLSQQSALSVMPMLSGSVTITPQGGMLAVDLGQAVNVVTGLDGASGAVDVIFPPVTTPDGRVNPDGLGTLLRVDAGADRLTWPGGTVVHGTPPEGQAAMASLVRVGGSVTVVWPPDVVTSVGAGVTAQVAKIEQIIGGEVEVQPGGTVMKEARPRSAAYGGGPAVFMNPHSIPTSDELVLTVGTVEQSLDIGDGGRLSVRTTNRAGGLRDYTLSATVTLDPPGEPVQNLDGWLIAVAPGPTPGDVPVSAALSAISQRLPFSFVERFTDGTQGVVLLYEAEDPNWEVYPWGDAVGLYYRAEGQPWGNGMTWTSELGLPMDVRTSSYESLGITLPGTFHRKAELEAMGVYLG